MTGASAFPFPVADRCRIAAPRAVSLDLRNVSGFLVVDVRGRSVGRVEGPMYGASPETPDALSVRFGLLSRRRRLIPAESIALIHEGTRVVGLRIERETIRTFL
jgi:hypothetical protein